MTVKLTVGEITALRIHLDEETGEIILNSVLLERINRYAFKYGRAQWRIGLRQVFRRTLGANLDRGWRFPVADE
jgi:hypothetical protein